jgi:hypothetical protein
MTNLSPDLLAVIDDLRRPRAIPPPPALASYAARLYAAMAPVAWLDGEADWALAKLDGAHLTGSKTVVLQERFGGDAYALAVYTLDTETPNPTQTRADILTQKPGGIVLTYAHGAPNTYAAVNAGYATYAAVKTAFSTYSRLAVNQPG